jgi:hypothetical protein
MKTEKNSPKSTRSALRVMVTDSIIEGSIRCDASKCMIAKAIRQAARTIGWRLGRVKVDKATMRFTDEHAGKRYIFFTPTHARAALLLFDHGQKPAPFGLVLRRCDAAQIIDVNKINSQPARVLRRDVKTRARTSAKRKGRIRLESVTVMNGRPLPLMPRQTTRVFGYCGMSSDLLRAMSAETQTVTT